MSNPTLNQIGFLIFVIFCFNNVFSQKTVSNESITDIDGNIYQTIKIGNQIWTSSNLNTSKLNDGTPIFSEIVSDSIWASFTKPAVCIYKNDLLFGLTHGKLYNWYAVNSGKLCPQGWHIPTKEDYQKLIDFLGGKEVAGEKLKQTFGWINSPQYSTNISNFSAFASGSRDGKDGFVNMGDKIWIWASDSDSENPLKAFRLRLSTTSEAQLGSYLKNDGKPCRCVKD